MHHGWDHFAHVSRRLQRQFDESDLIEIDRDNFELGDCPVLESAATCKVVRVRIVLPPASTVWGGILNAPALSGITV
jgi:hypothetical protein